MPPLATIGNRFLTTPESYLVTFSVTSCDKQSLSPSQKCWSEWWSCLPLTRTSYKLLTWTFATLRLLPTGVSRETESAASMELARAPRYEHDHRKRDHRLSQRRHRQLPCRCPRLESQEGQVSACCASLVSTWRAGLKLIWATPAPRAASPTATVRGLGCCRRR
jgi:hypothetical protein